MHFLFFPYFWWNVNFGSHHYPHGVQLAFAQTVESQGATRKETKCWLKAIEDKWTFHEAIGQYQYYIIHHKFTDEGWKVYISCLPVDKPDKDDKN
jgi:hypothetical protein